MVRIQKKRNSSIIVIPLLRKHIHYKNQYYATSRRNDSVFCHLLFKLCCLNLNQQISFPPINTRFIIGDV